MVLSVRYGARFARLCIGWSATLAIPTPKHLPLVPLLACLLRFKAKDDGFGRPLQRCEPQCPDNAPPPPTLEYKSGPVGGIKELWQPPGTGDNQPRHQRVPPHTQVPRGLKGTRCPPGRSLSRAPCVPTLRSSCAWQTAWGSCSTPPCGWRSAPGSGSARSSGSQRPQPPRPRGSPWTPPRPSSDRPPRPFQTRPQAQPGALLMGRNARGEEDTHGTVLPRGNGGGGLAIFGNSANNVSR